MHAATAHLLASANPCNAMFATVYILSPLGTLIDLLLARALIHLSQATSTMPCTSSSNGNCDWHNVLYSFLAVMMTGGAKPNGSNVINHRQHLSHCQQIISLPSVHFENLSTCSYFLLFYRMTSIFFCVGCFILLQQ